MGSDSCTGFSGKGQDEKIRDKEEWERYVDRMAQNVKAFLTHVDAHQRPCIAEEFLSNQGTRQFLLCMSVSLSPSHSFAC